MNVLRPVIAYLITVLVLVASYQLLVMLSVYLHADIKLTGLAALTLRAPAASWLLLLQAAALPAVLIILPLIYRYIRLMAAIGLGVAVGLMVYVTGFMFALMPDYTVLMALNVLAGNEAAMLPFVVPAGGFGGAAAWAMLSRRARPKS